MKKNLVCSKSLSKILFIFTTIFLVKKGSNFQLDVLKDMVETRKCLYKKMLKKYFIDEKYSFLAVSFDQQRWPQHPKRPSMMIIYLRQSARLKMKGEKGISDCSLLLNKSKIVKMSTFTFLFITTPLLGFHFCYLLYLIIFG